MNTETLETVLRDVYARHGELTPAIVVEEATPRSSVLHGEFLWDNKLAGHQYRLSQARQLIRSVEVTYIAPDQTEQKVRSWVNVREPEGSRSYRPLDEVAQDAFTSEMVKRDYERRWRQLLARYGHIVEFVELVRQDVDNKAS